MLIAEGCAIGWPQSQRLEPSRRPEIALTELTGWRWNWPLGQRRAALFGPHHRAHSPPAATCSPASARWNNPPPAIGKRLLKLGTHPRRPRCCWRPIHERRAGRDLAALLSRDRSRRRGIAARWQALAAFRNGRTRGCLRSAGRHRPDRQTMATPPSTITPDSPNINAGRIKRHRRGSDIGRRIRRFAAWSDLRLPAGTGTTTTPPAPTTSASC